MKLIHFSDIHVWQKKGWDNDPNLKRFLGKVNLRLNRSKRFPRELGSHVVEAIRRRDADAVVFTGDVTTASLVGEFASGRVLLAPLMEKWRERFVALPGNHDRYTGRSLRNQLFEKHFLQLPRTYPFALTLSEEVGLVGVDLSVPHTLSSRGTGSKGVVQSAGAMVRKQRLHTPFVVVMGHYPLVYPKDVGFRWSHVLPVRDALLSELLDAGAGLYLHGHHHQRWAIRCSETPPMLCLNSGSAGMLSTNPVKQAGFLEIEIRQGAVASVTSCAVSLKDGSVLEEELVVSE